MTTIIITSIDSKKCKWTWDVAYVEDSDFAAASFPIMKAVVMARSETPTATFTYNNSDKSQNMNDANTVFISPTNWLAVIDPNQTLVTKSASLLTKITATATLTADQTAYFDAVCASGRLPPPTTNNTATTSCTTQALTSLANPPAGIVRVSAAFKAMTSPFSAVSSTPAAEAFVVVKDKIENKFSITASKSLLAKFKAALDQRAVVVSTKLFHITPIATSTSTIPIHNTSTCKNGGEEEGLAIMLYRYLSDELWRHSEKISEVVVRDYEDDVPKQLSVMRLKQPLCKGDLCLVASVGSTYRSMVVLTNEDLHLLLANNNKSGGSLLINLSERKLIVGSADAEGSWAIKASADKDPKSAQNNTVNINVTIKARSAANATCYTIPVVPSPLPEEEDDVAMPAKVKPVVVTAGSLTAALPLPKAAIEARALPPPTSTGPALHDVPEIKVVHKPEVVTVAESSANGSSASAARLKAEAKNVTVSHGISSSGPTFRHYITAVAQVTNTTKEAEGLSCSAVKLEYKDKNGAWNHLESPQLVVSQQGGWGWGGGGGSTSVIDENIDLTDGQSVVAGARGFVEIVGAAGSDNWERARTHKSLPQPLEVRLTLTESVSGATHVIELQQANSPVAYKKQSEVASDWSVAAAPAEAAALVADSNSASASTINTTYSNPNFPLWVFADDCEAARRYHAGVYMSDEGLVLRHSEGSYCTYSIDDINAVAYKAAKAGQTSYDLDSISKKGLFTFTALCDVVDGKTPIWYGVVIKITTGTSVATGACHIVL